MNLLALIASAKDLFNKGKAINGSGMLTNIEAGSAALYGLFSALISFLQSVGITVSINGVDLHTMTHGWAITIALGYSAYRTLTNPLTGFKAGTTVTIPLEVSTEDSQSA